MSSGLLVVISGPSGVGKSSIIKEILRHPTCRLAVSATTRTPRPAEIDGVHYRFTPLPEFERLKITGHLLEFAEVHGNLYGTVTDEVDPWVARGQTVLLDVDVQGFRAVRAKRPAVIGIFVMPPAMETLHERLAQRGTEDPAMVARRLEHAKREVATRHEYDHVIVNDDLPRAVAQVESILGLSPPKAPRQGPATGAHS